MKSIIATIILIFATSVAFAQNRIVTHDSLSIENKTYYLKSAHTLFTGTAISSNNGGVKVIETQYVNGKVDGVEILYFANGKIETESHYKDGKYNGVMKNYYSDGSLKSEELYVNDYKNGKSTYYFPFERKEKEGDYENCMETGTWTFWDETGKKVTEKEFKNGEIVSEKKF